MWRALFLVVCAANIHVAISAECGLNERFIACPDTMCIPQYCSERGTKVPCPILGPDGECPGKPRCICIEGYLRDDTSANANGTCIKEKTCSYPPICPKGEEYYNCTGGCIPRKCSELGFPLDCSKCTPGCVCKDGLVRADNGSCIPVNKCPSCGGDKNAQQGCGSNCNKMCADIGKPPKRCPLGCIFNGCTCRPCYYYDPNEKKCVKPEDCTPTCSANEEYSTCIQSGCTAKNCSQLGKPVPCIKIDPKYCIKGCVCKKGMLRNSKGICVPENQCDNYPPKCPKGEEYNNCTGGCTLRKCSELGFPLDCDKCTPGCVCKDGLVRASNGSCIPANECPSCGGDKNAQQGCGNCNKMCSDIGKPPGPCPLRPCRINDCTCKPGFYYDPDKKKCVKPEHCTVKCGPNEVFSNCPNPCPPRKCNLKDAVFKCKAPPKPGDPECKPGCTCENNYYRNATGSCVLKKNCEKPLKCPDNEHYDPCPMTCPPQECGVNPAVILCLPNPEYGDPNCKPGCVCRDGELRNDARKCVPKECC
ncbi:zonadhesin-like isoform X2 [Leguminivora glycinivorella]|uniref:zonadhesin-like isoform X2 n=1 Tax=Leguminivora glycinivorella TaxID=1035111 RepID=UPI00200D216B|nr:zonadhesin-like isoform X2 [Leguminivora glycinivorella]